MKTIQNRWKPIIFICLLVLVGGCIDNNSKDTTLSNNDKSSDDDKNQDTIINDSDSDQDPVDSKNNDTPPQDEDPIIDLIDSRMILDIQIEDFNDIRTYERINYSVLNAPKESNITWEMGDNTFLYGEKVNYYYRTSNYFELNVTAVWDGKFALGTIIVPVKNRDWENFSVSGIADYKMIMGIAGMSLGPNIPNGITVPNIEVKMSIWNVTRDIEIGFKVRVWNDEDRLEDVEVLNSEIVEGKINEAYFEWEYSSDLMEKFEEFRPYSVQFFYQWVHFTGHANYYFEINIYF